MDNVASEVRRRGRIKRRFVIPVKENERGCVGNLMSRGVRKGPEEVEERKERCGLRLRLRLVRATERSRRSANLNLEIKFERPRVWRRELRTPVVLVL